MRAALAAVVVAGCGAPAARPDVARDAAADAAPDAPPKAVPCATAFGSGVAAGFGRIDGTVLAIVPPGDDDCTEPNSTHLVVQVAIADGAYRMVVDVLSNQGSPDVLFDELDAPLAGPAWSEGWHQPVAVDYPSTLGIHSTAFTAMHQADLVNQLTGELALGAHVSIYATATTSEPHSPHLVHRNASPASTDGAIVVGADATDGAPHWMLMRFDEDTF